MCLAVPGKIVRVEAEPDPTLRRATVDFSGIRKEISLAFTPEAMPGDYVIVHVGFALSVLDESEAQRILEDFERLGEVSAPPGDP